MTSIYLYQHTLLGQTDINNIEDGKWMKKKVSLDDQIQAERAKFICLHIYTRTQTTTAAIDHRVTIMYDMPLSRREKVIANSF